MKRINVHHFPQDPFQEAPQPRSHSRHHHRQHQHHSNRRYSFIHTHGTHLHPHLHHHHPQQQQHHLLSALTSRSFRKSLNLPRLRDQISSSTVPTPREDTGTNVATTPEEHSPSPSSTPIPLAATPRSYSFSATNDDDDRLVTQFLRDYLNHDGVLVLYILQLNTNEVITGEIVTALFELFKTNHRTETNE